MAIASCYLPPTNKRAGFGAFETNDSTLVVVGMTGLYLSVASRLAQKYIQPLNEVQFTQLHLQLINEFSQVFAQNKGYPYDGAEETILTGFGQLIIRPDGRINAFTTGFFVFNRLRAGQCESISGETTWELGDYILGDAEGAHLAPMVLLNLQMSGKTTDLSSAVGSLSEPFALLSFDTSTAPIVRPTTTVRLHKFRKALLSPGIIVGLTLAAVGLCKIYITGPSAVGNAVTHATKALMSTWSGTIGKRDAPQAKKASPPGSAVVTWPEQLLSRFQANPDSIKLLASAVESVTVIQDKTKQTDVRKLIDQVINTTSTAKAEQAHEKLDRAKLYAKEGRKQEALNELVQMTAIHKHLLPIHTYLTKAQIDAWNNRFLQKKQLITLLESEL